MTELFDASAEYGRQHIEEIIAESRASKRELPADLVRRYVTHHISYDFGERERQSLELFLRQAYELGLAERPRDLRYLEREPAIAQQD